MSGKDIWTTDEGRQMCRHGGLSHSLNTSCPDEGEGLICNHCGKDVDTHPTVIDSSWKPPLELPTEPTWGIAVYRVYDANSDGPYVEQALDEWGQGRPRESVLVGRLSRLALSPNAILDFIPLTDEQVARIEAAR